MNTRTSSAPANKQQSFKPPSAVQRAAQRGLEQRRRWGRGGLSSQEAGERGAGAIIKRSTKAKQNEPYKLYTELHAENNIRPNNGVDNQRLYKLLIARGVDKERAIKFSNAMLPPLSGLYVFKQASGKYRWVSYSSNSFRDRDSEIVSTAALAKDVARADKEGNYGPLRFWHVKTKDGRGIDLGNCDFNWLRGRTLIESGEFFSEFVAQRVALKANQYQLSIGFLHPPNEPDKDGVFHNIRRFERSLVPAGRAANPFTKLSLVKEKQMNDAAKMKALKLLLDGNEDELQKVLEGASMAEKQADDMGVAFKGYDGLDLNTVDADTLLDIAIARKEAQEQEKARKMAEGEDDEDYAMKVGEYVEALGGIVKKMGEYMGRMEKMYGSERAKSDSDQVFHQATNMHSSRIKGLEDRVKELKQELLNVGILLSDLSGGLPSDLARGYRPTQEKETIKEGEDPVIEAKAVAQKGNGSSLDGFLSFAVGGHGNV